MKSHPSFNTPPVDNDHVAFGCERFEQKLTGSISDLIDTPPMIPQADRSITFAMNTLRDAGFLVVHKAHITSLLKKWGKEADRDTLWARKAQDQGGAQNLMLANQYAFEAAVRKEYANELREMIASTK